MSTDIYQEENFLLSSTSRKVEVLIFITYYRTNLLLTSNLITKVGENIITLTEFGLFGIYSTEYVIIRGYLQ